MGRREGARPASAGATGACCCLFVLGKLFFSVRGAVLGAVFGVVLMLRTRRVWRGPTVPATAARSVSSSC